MPRSQYNYIFTCNDLKNRKEHSVLPGPLCLRKIKNPWEPMWGKGGGGVGAIQTKAAFAQTTPPPLFPRNVFRSGVFFGVWESAMSCWIWAFPPFLQARENKRS